MFGHLKKNNQVYVHYKEQYATLLGWSLSSAVVRLPDNQILRLSHTQISHSPDTPPPPPQCFISHYKRLPPNPFPISH